MLKTKVKTQIEKYCISDSGFPLRITAALSGGADSVAMLHALYSLKNELGFELCACHVNHNLRGEESDRDEMFVRRLCRFLDIPLYVKNIKVLEYMKKHDSVEECARNIRYTFFEEVRCNGLIATAHTASDNCETVLINMTRGTALSGVCGIPERRDNIIRPVLRCTREEIEEYCRANSLDFVTDSTNLSDDYVRNKIRHNVIPLLCEINPSLFAAISRMTEAVSLDDSYLDKAAAAEMKKAEKSGGYSVIYLSQLDECILRRIVTMLYKENDIPTSTAAINSGVQIIRSQKGKINPAQYKFVQIRKKILSVVTDYEKFRKVE